MTQAIVFQNADNSVGVLHPAPNCGLTIEQIAAKDVPTGRPYKIVEASTIPTDRTFRNAWEVEASELTDGVGLDELGKQNLMLEVSFSANAAAYMAEISNHENSTKIQIAELNKMIADRAKTNVEIIETLNNALTELNTVERGDLEA